MGRLVVSDENIIQCLKRVAAEGSFSFGLILGQCLGSADYIVHIARTLPSDEEASPEKVTDIKEAWISEHAKHVTRMLPGGLWVLGVFICTGQDVLQNNISHARLKSVLSNLKKSLSDDPLLLANSPGKERLIISYNTTNETCQCYSLDVSSVSASFKPAEWKQQGHIDWCKISCNYELDQSVRPATSSVSVRKQLKQVLAEVTGTVEIAVVAIDGEIYDDKETLEQLAKQQQKASETKDKKSFNAVLYLPLVPSDAEVVSQFVDVQQCDVEMRFFGVVSSEVVVHSKASVSEAISAVKQDIVRSLASRLEMHWDSLVEEEYQFPEQKQAFHEPPRRVLVDVGPVKLTEYLFPGENASEVVASFKELLDLDITEANVKSCEIASDPMELVGKSSMDARRTSCGAALRQSLPTGAIIGAVSFVFLLLALAVALYLQQSKDKQ